MLTKALRLTAKLVVHHTRSVRAAVGALVLLGIAANVWGLLHVDTDYLALLPRDKPEVRIFREAIKDFGSLDYLLVLVTAPAGASMEDHGAFLDALAKSLAASPHVAAVEHKLDLDSPLVRLLQESAILFLDGEEQDLLAARLSDEGIRAQVRRLRSILTTPAASGVKDLARRDPLGLLEVVGARFAGGGSGAGFDRSRGYYLARGGESALLVVKPTKPAQDVNFDEVFMADMETRAAQVAAAWSGDAPSIECGGSYVIALEDYRILRRDAAVNVLSSFGTILPLFAIGFGSVRGVKYAAVPLLAGTILAGGFGAVALGSFNPATASFAALLVGLAVDYVIVMYGRFFEERGRGATPDEAAAVVIEKTGRSVFLGAVTTAATFFALCTVDFKGLSDLGLLSGSGILLCFLVILVLVPAMLLEDARAGGRTARPIRSMGFERLASVAAAWPRTTLATALVLSLASVAAIPRVPFNDDLRTLRAEGNHGIDVQRQVAERFGTSFDYAMVIARGGSFDDVLRLGHELDARLERLVADGVLTRFDSVTRYLPDGAAQSRNLDWLREQRRSGALDPARVRSSLERELHHAGFRVPSFTAASQALERALLVDTPVTADVLDEPGLEHILGRYVRHDADGWKSVTYAYPEGARWKREVPPPLREAVGSLGGRADVTGVSAISQALRGGIRRQAAFAITLGLALVLLMVGFEVRSAKAAAMVMTPLAVGVLWMVGIMWLAGLSFDFFNIFVAAMILGIGVDYGIHATHRYLERGAMDFGAAFGVTGRAIVFAALTDVLGFGSFATSSFRGLHSIGMVSIIGVSTCTIACFTVLPSLLVLAFPPAAATPVSGTEAEALAAESSRTVRHEVPVADVSALVP